jgi:hypothetical protein
MNERVVFQLKCIDWRSAGLVLDEKRPLKFPYASGKN